MTAASPRRSTARSACGTAFPELDSVIRAKTPVRLPVVLTRREVRRLLARMEGVPALMAGLLYGGGLRLLECVGLRIQQIDFERREILVRDGKGRKDRRTILPARLVDPLETHLRQVKAQHEADLQAGLGAVALPDALARKVPSAPKE